MSTRPARGLYDRMTTFESLWTAARLARRGKRRSPSTAKFEHRLESVLLHLQQALRAEQYTFGAYRTFAVPLPSPRVIRAAPYRDRVVHHAMHAQLEPLLERRMIEHSFACRVGKGTHRALDTLQQFLRGGAWVLKLDISKYFYSIDHAILQQQLATFASANANTAASAGCHSVNAGVWNVSLSGTAAGQILSTVVFAAGETIHMSIVVNSTNTRGDNVRLRVPVTNVEKVFVSSSFGPVSNTFTGQYAITGAGDLTLYGAIAAGNGTGVVTTTRTHRSSGESPSIVACAHWWRGQYPSSMASCPRRQCPALPCPPIADGIGHAATVDAGR